MPNCVCQFLFQRSYLEFFFRVKCTWTASKPSGLIVLLLYRAMNTLRSSLICEMQSKTNRIKPCKTCRILFLFLYSHVQWLCTMYTWVKSRLVFIYFWLFIIFYINRPIYAEITGHLLFHRSVRSKYRTFHHKVVSTFQVYLKVPEGKEWRSFDKM